MIASAPATGRKAGQPWPKKDAAEFLATSVRTVERLIARRQLKSVKIGSRTYIPDAEVRRLAGI